MKNVYKNTPVNPLSVERFNVELKMFLTENKKHKRQYPNFLDGEITGYKTINSQKELSDYIGCTEQYINALKKGSRRLTIDMAEKFGELFGVYPKYLLGLTDERRYTKKVFQEEMKFMLKRDDFIGRCFEYFGYEFIKHENIYYEESETVIGIKYTIKTPDDNTFTITHTDLEKLAEDILNYIHGELNHCAKIRQ
ncbi:MAG: helix-turn-helix transcriptional regulator [Oscillospiraceae bacterium]|nr:helix-turn-helix transcriptional regulator [Oscillospiraceae bacterium]